MTETNILASTRNSIMSKIGFSFNCLRNERNVSFVTYRIHVATWLPLAVRTFTVYNFTHKIQLAY